MDDQSKQKNIVIVVILLLILVALAVGYFYFSNWQKGGDAPKEKVPAIGLDEKQQEEVNRQSRDARRRLDIGQIQLALELYFDAHGTYPNSLLVLTTQNSCGSSACRPIIPVDPLGSGVTGLCRPNYCYAYPATGLIKTYHLGAQFEFASSVILRILKDDADFNSKESGYKGTAFDGSDTGLIYDATP